MVQGLAIRNELGAITNDSAAIKVKSNSGFIIQNFAGTLSATLSATAGSTLTISASLIVPGISVTGASSGAVAYFDSSANLITTLTGSTTQVLIGGTTPSFGSVTSSTVDSSVIIASGANPFTGNQSFGGNNITNVGIISANTVQASTTNANLTIQPNGSGTRVVIVSGKILTADTLQSTAALTDLTLSATGTNVAVATGKLFKITDAVSGAVPYFNASAQMVTNVTGTSSQVLIGGTTPSFSSIDSSMLDSSVILASGTNPFTGSQDFGGNNITGVGTISANTVQASSINTNLTLQASGSASQVNIVSGNILTADTLQSTTASTDLTLSATGTNVTIASGKSFKITGASSGAVPYFNASSQMVTNVTGTSNQVLIGGTTPAFSSVTSSMVNSTIIVAAGTNAFTGNQSFGGNNILGVGTISANTVQASTTNSNLTIQPNGSGTQVNIATGKTLTADTLQSTTASTDLTLSATGTNVTIGTSKSLKITGASSGAVPYFNSSAQMVTSVTGTAAQVLIGGTTPAFGSVTSSMVNSTVIVAAGTNAFTGNQSFGNHQATSFRVENVSANPAAGNAGKLVWNTTASALEVDNGASFTPLLTSESYDFIGATTSTSSAITNTNTLTFFNQTFSIPANTLVAGSVIKIFATGLITSWSTGGLSFAAFLSGAGFSMQTAAYSQSLSSTGTWILEASIVCQTSGAGGTGIGSLKTSVPTGATTSTSFNTQAIITSNSLATTGVITVEVGVQWNTASSSNSLAMYIFDVSVLT